MDHVVKVGKAGKHHEGDHCMEERDELVLLRVR